MFGHYSDQLLVAQNLPRYMLPICDLVRPHCILRLQSGPVQQLLQLIRREMLLHIVNALDTDSFRSQDTLDLSTLGSRRLFVNNDLGCGLHSSRPFSAEILLPFGA